MIPDSRLYGGPRDRWSEPAPTWAADSWGPYFDRLYPVAWTNGFGHWKRQTNGRYHARRLWELRDEQHRAGRTGPTVLVVPWVAYAACLDCTWLNVRRAGDARDARQVRRTWRVAKRHLRD